MENRICGLGVELVYSPEFLAEVDRIIDLNLSSPMNLVGLFVSRLIKGLQNMSNSESEFRVNWGTFEYQIEDIGTVIFRPMFDPESGDRFLVVESIIWQFSTSVFFSSFVTE